MNDPNSKINSDAELTLLLSIPQRTPFEKLKSHYKRMLKVELINNLKGAYYRVDLRIK